MTLCQPLLKGRWLAPFWRHPPWLPILAAVVLYRASKDNVKSMFFMLLTMRHVPYVTENKIFWNTVIHTWRYHKTCRSFHYPECRRTTVLVFGKGRGTRQGSKGSKLFLSSPPPLLSVGVDMSSHVPQISRVTTLNQWVLVGAPKLFFFFFPSFFLGITIYFEHICMPISSLSGHDIYFFKKCVCKNKTKVPFSLHGHVEK